MSDFIIFIIGFGLGLIGSGMLLIVLVYFQNGFKEDINNKAKKIFNEDKQNDNTQQYNKR